MLKPLAYPPLAFRCTSKLIVVLARVVKRCVGGSKESILPIDTCVERLCES